MIIFQSSRRGPPMSMDRREFFTFLSSTAAVSPLTARAQQPPMPVVGLMHLGSSEAFSTQQGLLRQGLKENGYLEDKNVAIEYRWAEGQLDRLRKLATNLVRQKVDVIASLGGTNSVLAAKAATTDSNRVPYRWRPGHARAGQQPQPAGSKR